MKDLELQYSKRYSETLTELARELEEHILDNLADVKRIDRVTARAKTVESFIDKARRSIDGGAKYSDPLNEIQDQVGARIIMFFQSDVDELSDVLLKYYVSIEDQLKVPESDWEFGYFGKHYVFRIPTELTSHSGDAPEFFELQIKTLFQHAWSEANHDVGYKSAGCDLSSSDKRMLAYTSAQAWGADQAFNDLHLRRVMGVKKKPSKSRESEVGV